MRHIVAAFLAFIAAFINIKPTLGPTPTPMHITKNCWTTAMTQAEMNLCAYVDARNADAEMHQLYQKLLRKASNKAYRKKLESAQSAWLAYRSAEVEAKYPAEDKREYGSAYPMCADLDRVYLTQERIKELRGLLQTSEGNLCASE